MDNKSILDGLAVFTSAYAKRWLDGRVYDEVFQTKLGRRLKALDNKAKYGIEFGLNLLTAFFDQKLSEDTVLKRLVKEVGLDLGPELSKRMINGKERIAQAAVSAQEKEIVDTLLQLEDETLIALLRWLYDIDATKRAQILKRISQLPVDDLTKLIERPPEEMRQVLEPDGAYSAEVEKPSLLSQEAVNKIEAATERIEQMRDKIRQRRKEH